jgi:transposase
MNRRLFKPYRLKERFAHAWTCTTEQGMRALLQRWQRLLNGSRLTPLIAFYDLVMRHINGVAAWARHRLTNAAREGNDVRVRAISQRAHGYRNPRNPNNLMLVLYHLSWR